MLRTLMILQRVIVMTDVVKSWKRNMVPSDLPLPEPHRSGNYIYFSNSPTRLVNFARIGAIDSARNTLCFDILGQLGIFGRTLSVIPTYCVEFYLSAEQNLSGSNGLRSTVVLLPFSSSSATARPEAGLCKMPQQLWPVHTYALRARRRPIIGS